MVSVILRLTELLSTPCVPHCLSFLTSQISLCQALLSFYLFVYPYITLNYNFLIDILFIYILLSYISSLSMPLSSFYYLFTHISHLITTSWSIFYFIYFNRLYTHISLLIYIYYFDRLYTHTYIHFNLFTTLFYKVEVCVWLWSWPST